MSSRDDLFRCRRCRLIRLSTRGAPDRQDMRQDMMRPDTEPKLPPGGAAAGGHAGSEAPRGEPEGEPDTRARLVALLLERGHCDVQMMERARRVAAESGQAIESVLIQLGLVTERALAEACAS